MAPGRKAPHAANEQARPYNQRGRQPAQPLPHWLEPGNSLGDMLAAQNLVRQGHQAVPGPAWSKAYCDDYAVAAQHGQPSQEFRAHGYQAAAAPPWNLTEQHALSHGAGCEWSPSGFAPPSHALGAYASPESYLAHSHYTSSLAQTPQLHRHASGHWDHAPPTWADHFAPLRQEETSNVAEALGLLNLTTGTPLMVPRMAVAPASHRDDSIALPPHVQIRNTFLNSRPVRSESMERVFVERKVRSTPGSRHASLSRPQSASSDPTTQNADPPYAIATPSGSSFNTTPQRTPQRSPREYFNKMAASQYLSEQLNHYVPAMPEERSIPEGYYATGINNLSSHRSSSPLSCSSSSANPYKTSRGSGLRASENSRRISVAESLAKDELLAGAIPSRGSALHQWGACKPCAFFIKESCGNGAECPFCHLCETGEKKRRKKERASIRKEMRDKLRASRSGGGGGNRW